MGREVQGQGSSTPNVKTLRVGILGASGYTGFELIRLLRKHPYVEITVLTAERHAGKSPEEVFPSLRGMGLPPFLPIDAEGLGDMAELFFVALPHGVSMKAIGALWNGQRKLIDLSADFRLKDPELYRLWYGEHIFPELLKEAVYGLPERYREEIRKARLVANPGCYPTAVLIGLMPLVERGLIAPNVIVDAKSGVSGAGRALEEGLMFCEVAESIRAYGVLVHRHKPEMEQELARISGKAFQVEFVPHLVPMNRGILATMYCKLEQAISENDLYELYLERFKGEPFVKVLPPGRFPSTSSVRGTNFCSIGLRAQGNTLVVISAIDNLTKGASGQAVQNMNLMAGFPEITGLEDQALYP